MTAETSAFTTDFAAEFTATEDQWRKAAEAALKGRPLDAILNARTIDGVPFEAISARREAKAIAGRPAGARWTAMTRIDIADPEAANAQALEDLNNGASGLSLVFADSRPERARRRHRRSARDGARRRAARSSADPSRHSARSGDARPPHCSRR